MTGQIERTCRIRHCKHQNGLRRFEPDELSASRQLHRLANDAPGNGRRLLQQRPNGELKAAGFALDDPPRDLERLTVEELRIISRDSRLAVEHIDHPCGKPLFEERDQLVANSIARNAKIGIRGVLTVFEPMLVKKVSNIFAGGFDERTNHQTRPRVHPTQTTRARAPQQPKQKCFGLVVARVGHRHRGGTQARGCALEERVTRIVRRMLDGRAGVACEPGDVEALHDHWQGQPGGQTLAEFFVPVGLFAAELMVEVSRAGNLESPAAGNIPQHAEQGHRIGPARQRHKHTGARLDQGVPPERAPDALNQWQVIGDE